jgi:serine/threonine-protein kinase HipA
VLFNLLIGNGDAHLKNISFFQIGEGSVLTPFYDLLSTIIYASPHETLNQDLSIAIGGKLRFGEVTFHDLEVFAGEIGLPAKVMHKMTADMTSIIGAEFESLYKRVMQSDTHIQKAAELRMIREIKHKVLIPILNNIAPAPN